MSEEPMTLDFAIQHALEASERPDLCEECRKEHKQLAEWLMELRSLRADKTPHQVPVQDSEEIARRLREFEYHPELTSSVLEKYDSIVQQYIKE